MQSGISPELLISHRTGTHPQSLNKLSFAMQEDRSLIRTDIDIDAFYPSASPEPRRTSRNSKVEDHKRELMSVKAFVDFIDRLGDYRQIDRSAIHIIELTIGT